MAKDAWVCIKDCGHESCDIVVLSALDLHYHTSPCGGTLVLARANQKWQSRPAPKLETIS